MKSVELSVCFWTPAIKKGIEIWGWQMPIRNHGYVVDYVSLSISLSAQEQLDFSCQLVCAVVKCRVHSYWKLGYGQWYNNAYFFPSGLSNYLVYWTHTVLSCPENILFVVTGLSCYNWKVRMGLYCMSCIRAKMMK